MKLASTTAVCAAGILSLAAAPAANAQFYADKTITLLIGFAAGGGSSRHANAHIQFWRKHIPGNPKIIVKHMPGAGGMKAANFLADKVKPDGLTVLFGGFSPLNQVLDTKGLRARYSDFVFIGGGAGHQASIVRTDVGSGISKPADLLTAEGLIVGGLRPSILLDLQSRMSLDVLGVKYRYVPGYRGSAKIFAAMARNEINFYTTGNAPYHTRFKPQLIDKGQAVALWHFPKRDETGKVLNRNPVFGDLKSFPEVVREVTGKDPSGKVWRALTVVQELHSKTTQAMFAPKGTPAEAVAALRKGFLAASKDPGLVAVYEKQFGGPLIYASVSEGEAMLRSLDKLDKDVVETIRAYARPKR